MARVTTEDCADKIPNRFDLVMLAAFRAREIAAGSEITVHRDNDKNPVVSLREIADETQIADELHERVIQSFQTQNEVDDPDDDGAAIASAGISAGDRPAAGDMDEDRLLRQLMESKDAS